MLSSARRISPAAAGFFQQVEDIRQSLMSSACQMRCSAIRREKGVFRASVLLRKLRCDPVRRNSFASFSAPAPLPLMPLLVFLFCAPPAAPRRAQICMCFARTKEKNSLPPRRTTVGVGQLCFEWQERQRKKRRHVSSRCAEQGCTRLRFVGGDTKGVSPLGHLW